MGWHSLLQHGVASEKGRILDTLMEYTTLSMSTKWSTVSIADGFQSFVFIPLPQVLVFSSSTSNTIAVIPLLSQAEEEAIDSCKMSFYNLQVSALFKVVS
jgi:hypothetical protein